MTTTDRRRAGRSRMRLGVLMALCRLLSLEREPANRAIEGAVNEDSRPEAQLRGLSRSDWHQVARLAYKELLAPALWSTLERRRLAGSLPSELTTLLRAAHRQNVGRNQLLRQSASQIVQQLNHAGVVPMLLKGSLYLFDGTFPDLGARFLADLDLIVSPEDLATSIESLRDLEWVPEPGKPFLHPHELPLVRPRTPFTVELHTSVGSKPLPSVLPTGDLWADSEQLEIGPAKARAMSPSHRVMHTVLHSQVQDLNHAVGGIALRQLYTLARLIDVLGEHVDWGAVANRADEHGLGRVFRACMFQTHALLHTPLPPTWRADPLAVTHHLRCLAFYELGWPADVLRNVRFAFGRDYIADRYGQGDHGVGLAAARIQHAIRLVRQKRRGVIGEARVHRV